MTDLDDNKLLKMYKDKGRKEGIEEGMDFGEIKRGIRFWIFHK